MSGPCFVPFQLTAGEAKANIQVILLTCHNVNDSFLINLRYNKQTDYEIPDSDHEWYNTTDLPGGIECNCVVDRQIASVSRVRLLTELFILEFHALRPAYMIKASLVRQPATRMTAGR